MSAAGLLPVSAVQLAYIAVCLAGMFAIFTLQRHRHRKAAALLWWTYTALAYALAWEAIDAWNYAPPGWPASRWLLVPALAAIMTAAAVRDWKSERRTAGPAGPDR